MDWLSSSLSKVGVTKQEVDKSFSSSPHSSQIMLNCIFFTAIRFFVFHLTQDRDFELPFSYRYTIVRSILRTVGLTSMMR